MTAEQTEEQQDAEALLATARHLMTGKEIDICERIVSGECAEWPDLPDHELWDVEVVADHDASACYPTRDEQPILASLRIQFYAQITNYKNGRAVA